MSEWDLQHDERVLWQGVPRRGFVCRPEQFASFLVGTAMVAASVWLLVAVVSNGLELGGLLFSIVIAGVGIYLTFGIVSCDIAYRRVVRYAITDRRILINSQSVMDGISSIGLLKANGKPLPMSVTFDGCITLGTPPLLGHIIRFWGPLYRIILKDPRLECLEKPAAVYQIIRSAQRRLGATGIEGSAPGE